MSQPVCFVCGRVAEEAYDCPKWRPVGWPRGCLRARVELGDAYKPPIAIAYDGDPLEAEKTVAEAEAVLQEYGYPPADIAGPLPVALRAALDCLIRQRNDLLNEVVTLRDTQEACARVCDELAAKAKEGKTSVHQLRRAKVSRGAFKAAARAIRALNRREE